MNHIETFKPMSTAKIAGIFAALVLTMVALLSLGLSQSASASEGNDTSAAIADHEVDGAETDFVDGCIVVTDGQEFDGDVIHFAEDEFGDLTEEEIAELEDGEVFELTEEEIAELEENGFIEFLDVDGEVDTNVVIELGDVDDIDFEVGDYDELEDGDYIEAEELFLTEGDIEDLEDCADLSEEEMAQLEAEMERWKPFDECVQAIYNLDEDEFVSSDVSAKELDCVDKAPTEEQEMLRASIEDFVPFEECLANNVIDVEDVSDESFDAAFAACEEHLPEDVLIEADWTEAEPLTEDA